MLKKTISIAVLAGLVLVLAGGAQGEMIVGWHTFVPESVEPFDQDVALTGVTGTVDPTMITQDTWSSTDGTYGAFSSGAAGTGSGSVRARDNDPNVDVSITNNTGGDLTLDTFHFDIGKVLSTASNDVALQYLSGNLADPDGTAINSATGLTALADSDEADWGDFDWSLAGLSDRTLANGESATFRLTFSNGSNDGQALGLDNIAISGTPTPEPATMSLLALGGLALVRRRRSR